MTLSWQDRRSKFSHDWLKNQFLPALSKFLNLLDDKVEDPEFEASFVSRVLPQWESHFEEALNLARDFEEEMSPQQMLQTTSLSRCDENTRQWLSSTAHRLWLARYPVHQWTSDACICVERVSGAYDRLCEALLDCENTRSAPILQVCRELFAGLRERCQDLANAMERFPREILVT
jgi:hypothetical protein